MVILSVFRWLRRYWSLGGSDLLGIRSFQMEAEVNALMGATDEALWNRAGLFASTDAISTGTCFNTSKLANIARLTQSPLVFRDKFITVSPFSSETLPGGSSKKQRAGTLNIVGGQDVLGRTSSHLNLGGKEHRAQGGKGIRKKLWNSNRSKRRMVMGADIGLEETCNLALCALVGRLSYRSLCKKSLPAWVMSTWTPLLGYAP
jgi:hypothetical protein